MRLYNSIKWRLITAFLAVSGLTLLVGVVAILNFNDFSSEVQKILDHDFSAVYKANELAVISQSTAVSIPSLAASIPVNMEDRGHEPGMQLRDWPRVSSQLNRLRENITTLPEIENIKLKKKIMKIFSKIELLAKNIYDTKIMITNDEKFIQDYVNTVFRSEEAVLDYVKKNGGLCLDDFSSITENTLPASKIKDSVFRMLLLLNEAKTAKSVKKLRNIRNHFKTISKQFDAIKWSPDIKKHINIIKNCTVNNKDIFYTYEKILIENKRMKNQLIMAQNFASQLTGYANDFSKLVLENARKREDKVKVLKRQIIFFIVMSGLISLLISFFVVWLVVIKNIINRIDDLRDKMINARNGDLEIEIPIKGKDEISDMMLALKFFITSFKHHMEMKKEMEQADMANRIKSQFLTNMSHEIRTPMNAILGLSHLLNSTGLSQKQHDYLNKIQSASQILLGIIDDILDFSRIETGTLKLENKDFSLNDVLDNLYNIAGLTAKEKKLNILFNVDSKVPTSLKGDPVRLNQVLINLLNNAVKFTHEGEILLNIQKIKEDKSRVLLSFSVKDTGIGIPADKKEYLFDAFIQADNSITKNFGGTGLGLAICKQLVEMMGGEITVDSEPGKGSLFSFTVWMEMLEKPVHAVSSSSVTYKNGTDTMPEIKIDGHMKIMDPDDFIIQSEELINLLKKGEVEAETKFNNMMQSGLENTIGKLADKMSNKIRNFDFEEAAHILESYIFEHTKYKDKKHM